uniref:Myb/SANT-like DNA-binding domain-containing protein n=1 Tax=Poecilia reticulata TaxID=8081 RepID=A0A3P9Q4J6_POERE
SHTGNNKVQAFLVIIGDCSMQCQLDGTTRNEKVFVEVSERMAGAGSKRTSQQCREKLKKLKSEYKNMKDHNGRSGLDRKQWRLFDHMDRIYGHRPASRGREGGMDLAVATHKYSTQPL